MEDEKLKFLLKKHNKPENCAYVEKGHDIELQKNSNTLC